MRIGLMGGSFDPIHMGHLILAQQILEKLELDQVVFIPNGYPPHKNDGKVTDQDQRYRMVQLAIANNPNFTISDIEMHKGAVHYTVDTLRELIARDKSPNDYYFITGADAVLDLEGWRSCEILLSLCRFVGATRPGVEYAHLEETIQRLQAKYGDRIELVEISSISLSSTEIRQRRREGKSIRYLVPDSVYDYIEEIQLYRDPS